MVSCIVHMISYICKCEDVHGSCNVFNRVVVVTYTVDVMADRMGFKSDIEPVLSYTQCV